MALFVHSVITKRGLVICVSIELDYGVPVSFEGDFRRKSWSHYFFDFLPQLGRFLDTPLPQALHELLKFDRFGFAVFHFGPVKIGDGFLETGLFIHK